jgi:hypothetical protein
MSPRSFFIAFRSVRAAAAAAAIAFAAACGDSSTEPVKPNPNPDPAPAPVASISLSPESDQITVQRQRTLTAVLRARDGRELTGRTIVWSSSDERVAIVHPGGVVTTVTPGTVTIVAESEGKSAQARLTVVPRAVASIHLQHPSLALEVGAAQFIGVTLLDDAGQVFYDRTAQFRVENPAIATVDAAGRVVAVSSGVTHVTVTAESKTARAEVVVTGPVDPRMAGTWQVVIEDIVGGGTRCTIEGLRFTVTQQGELLGGAIDGANGGPHVSCEIVDGQPPFVTPLAPIGPISGRVTRDLDGAVVTLQSGNGWAFSGLMRGGVFAGLARYDRVEDDRIVDSRRGEIYAVQLNQR